MATTTATMNPGHTYTDHVEYMLGEKLLSPTQGDNGGYAFIGAKQIVARSPITGLRPVIEQAIEQTKKANPRLTGDALESKIAQTLTGYNDWADLTAETQNQIMILTGINFDSMTDAQRETTINHLIHSPLPFGHITQVLTPDVKIDLSYTHTLDKTKTLVESMGGGNWKITMISNNNNGSHTGHSLGSFVVNLGLTANAELAKTIGNSMVSNTNDNTKLYLSDGARDILYGNVAGQDFVHPTAPKMEAGHTFFAHASHLYGDAVVETQKEYSGHTFLSDKYLIARSTITGLQPVIEQAIKATKAANPTLTGDALESKIAQTLTGYNDWADLTVETQAELMILTGIDFGSMTEEAREKTLNHLLHSPVSFGVVDKVLTRDVKIDMGYTHTLDKTKTLVESLGDGVWMITMVSNNNNGSHTGHTLGQFKLNAGTETDVTTIKQWANDMVANTNDNTKLYLDQAARDILYGNVKENKFDMDTRFDGKRGDHGDHLPKKDYELTGSNLIKNGTFEANKLAGYYQVFNNGQVEGWTNTGTNTLELQWKDWNKKDDNVLELDSSYGVDAVSQTMKTVAGKTYELSFDAALRPDNAGTSTFEVVWNGKVIAQINPAYKSFLNYTYKVTGTGNDTLTFRELSGENNHLGAVLDNVSLFEIKPKDTGVINGTAGNDGLVGTDKNDKIYGLDGNDTMYGGKGDDLLDGGAGDYNQVDYDGAAKDYAFTKNSDGSITVKHPVYGTDTLKNIDGLWFMGEAKWYSLDDVLNPNPVGKVINGTAGNDGLVGTAGNDTINGLGGNDTMYGGKGDDVIDGGTGEYNQVDYDGAAKDYTFTKNSDGSVTVKHPVFGTDTLKNIDGLWFMGEAKWYSVDDLAKGTPGSGKVFEGTAGNDGLVGTDGNDVFNGYAGDDTFFGGAGNDRYNGGEGYDQVDYTGKMTEYHVTKRSDGTITVEHAATGKIDTLTGIDGLYFYGDGEWMDPNATDHAH